MKLEDKIYASIGLTVFLTIAYYYVYSFVDLYVSKLCDKYVCFEFPPYADVLAIYVAIVGLYFVVTSLDAWKSQDKYQTAKLNIKDPLTLKDKLIGLCHKLNNIYRPYLESENKIIRYGDELETVKNILEEYIYKSQLEVTVNKILETNKSSNSLFQNDFDKISKRSNLLLLNIKQDVKLIEKTVDNKEGDYNFELKKIYIKYVDEIENLIDDIDRLNTEIKNCVE